MCWETTISSLIPVWACNAANGEHRATFEFVVEGFPIFGVPLKGAMGDIYEDYIGIDRV